MYLNEQISKGRAAQQENVFWDDDICWLSIGRIFMMVCSRSQDILLCRYSE